MSDISQNISDFLKENLSSKLGIILAIVMAGLSFVNQYSSRNTRIEDLQKDQERRLELLEKDAVTRREVDAVKATVDRIENKLDSYRDEEVVYHHRRKIQ
jgi:multidrug resistance efflux pump